MSVAKEALVYDLDYSAWANRSLLEACAKLTNDEVTRDLKTGHGSILSTMRHIFYAERVWLKRLRENRMPVLREVGDQRLFQDPAPEPDIDALTRSWPAVWNGLREYADAQSESGLCAALSGPDCTIPVWRLLLHTVNHSTLHRGQVVGMLRQLGKQPPQIDIFSFHLAG